MPHSAAGLGWKNPGTPWVNTPRLANAFPNIESQGILSDDLVCTRSQNSLSRSSRSAGLLPAISAALMAPIEVPITQPGSMPASLRPW
jgi:hypothetical protein